MSREEQFSHLPWHVRNFYFSLNFRHVKISCFLPYKEFMPELQDRKLIEKTGIRTFPRPHGIPQNFRIQISDKGL